MTMNYRVTLKPYELHSIVVTADNPQDAIQRAIAARNENRLDCPFTVVIPCDQDLTALAEVTVLDTPYVIEIEETRRLRLTLDAESREQAIEDAEDLWAREQDDFILLVSEIQSIKVL